MSSISGQELRRCFCGDVAKVCTSWTSKNPGRRFIGCPNYKSGRGCNYFSWIEPRVPDWYASKMLEIRDERKRNEEEIEKLKKKLWCKGMIIRVIVCCCILYFLLF